MAQIYQQVVPLQGKPLLRRYRYSILKFKFPHAFTMTLDASTGADISFYCTVVNNDPNYIFPTADEVQPLKLKLVISGIRADGAAQLDVGWVNQLSTIEYTQRPSGGAFSDLQYTGTRISELPGVVLESHPTIKTYQGIIYRDGGSSLPTENFPGNLELKSLSINYVGV